MKNYFLLLVIVFSVNRSSAQKQDSIPGVKPTSRIIPVKTTNIRLVNQKLVQLQATVKKLETTLNEAKALMDKLGKQKDAISELSQDDMFQLQQLMEKKSQLEQMISNVMKAASESQSNITKNLKAS
jgi:septal ring factor EnvC (AmiA/AmiB activator)